MAIVYLLIGNSVDLRAYPFEKGGVLIGVDRGAYFASQGGLSLDLAYGDFDSVTPAEFVLIQQHAKRIIRLNSHKDISDAYGAYLEAKDAEKIVVVGGISGKRIEHFLALYNLLRSDPRVSLVDDHSSLCQLLARDEPYVFSQSQGKYFSFYSIGEATLSLTGFVYPLSHYVLKEGDSLCLSNEIKDRDGEGKVYVEKGAVVLIISQDDHPGLFS